MAFSRFPRLLAIVALLGSLMVSGVTPAAAAAPAVSATLTTVPFSETPGLAGTTKITVAADAGTAYSVCVSDNGTNKLITTVPNGGPTSFDAPFIQSGTYSFFASTSADCANAVGTAAKVQRAGPTGKLGADDFTFAPKDDFTITANQQFPIPGKLCIMSGDGKQKQVNLQLGQDPRVYGATAAVTEMNAIVQGQNGCFAANFLVNGYYKFGFGGGAGSATPGGMQGTAGDVQFGFCVAANAPDKTDPAPITLDRHCAQIAYATSPVLGGALTPVTGGLGPTGGLFLNLLSTPNIIGVGVGAVINGAAVTGASDHAIQTCLYVALPTGTFISLPFGITIPNPATAGNGNLLLFGSTAQGYNGSGAINLTNVVASFGQGAVLLLTTYDVTKPGTPGGLGAAQQTCPGTTALFGAPNVALGITLPALGGVSNVVQNILLPPDPANMKLIDARYFVQLT